MVKDSTRRESLLRRRLKSSAGDASAKEEMASTCDRWSESEVVDWDTVVNDSDSGDERIGEEGRVLTTRVLYWEEEAAEEKETKRQNDQGGGRERDREKGHLIPSIC